MPPSGPRRFNWFTAFLLLVLGTGVYLAWKFFPVYWEAWQVDRILADGAAKAYSVSRYREPQRGDAERDLINGMRAKVVALGVRDPTVTVKLTYEGSQAVMTCDYMVIVQHPVGGKQTKLVMKRRKSADLKKVSWD
jgi:hypothetical protein